MALTTMLSHTLVAWIVEVDNAFELRMPHCTTASRKRGEAIKGPWLVSFAMYVHCLRYLTAEGVTRDELERRARVLGPVLGLERWGYVTVTQAPRQGKRKPDPRAAVVRPTAAGRKAQSLWATLPDDVDARWKERYGENRLQRLRAALIPAVAAQQNYLTLTGDIERRWATRFGSEVVRGLRSSLEAIVVTPELGGSPLAEAYGPVPGTWRADMKTPDTLPHYPMVNHRGGFPDGA